MSGGNPTATVIVPTLNHAETVAACLDGLASQTLASDKMEVLVVDAGSSDATVAAVVAWLARHEGINARLLREKLGSLALARNAAPRPHARMCSFFSTPTVCRRRTGSPRCAAAWQTRRSLACAAQFARRSAA